MNVKLLLLLPLYFSSPTADSQPIAAGDSHSLAVCNDGTVRAWGENVAGELGNGTTSPKDSVPVQVSGLTDVISVSGGGHHSLFLKTDGTVWACGLMGKVN